MCQSENVLRVGIWNEPNGTMSIDVKVARGEVVMEEFVMRRTKCKGAGGTESNVKEMSRGKGNAK